MLIVRSKSPLPFPGVNVGAIVMEKLLDPEVSTRHPDREPTAISIPSLFLPETAKVYVPGSRSIVTEEFPVSTGSTVDGPSETVT
ncbi:MAG: hypothetical protein A2Y36_09500 [Treponema sp. GWA1_62_8]|nr:MAG: hypothetical protein A2Y36_09500 [Treponema sp. GWA1_62_8]